MEVIIQDGLPKGCYEFQFTLSNRSRPDCVIFLPDQRPLVIDAKFPLEAVNAFRDAKTDDERKLAAARLRADIGRHVADIAAKYLIPGETQDLAMMFVPSESVYAELLRRLRRRGAEGLPRQGRHRVAVAADARDQRGAADPEGRAHARGRRQDPRRGRPPDGRHQAIAGARAARCSSTTARPARICGKSSFRPKRWRSEARASGRSSSTTMPICRPTTSSRRRSRASCRWGNNSSHSAALTLRSAP